MGCAGSRFSGIDDDGVELLNFVRLGVWCNRSSRCTLVV